MKKLIAMLFVVALTITGLTGVQGVHAATSKKVVALVCGQNMSKPSSMTPYCADWGIYIDKITWKHWSKSAADGVATYHANDCDPYCAVGKLHSASVKITLLGLKTTAKFYQFTKVRITAVSKSGIPLLADKSIVWTLY